MCSMALHKVLVRAKVAAAGAPAAARRALGDTVHSPLHALHAAHGARLVPFSGMLLPVRYADASESASHLFTRAHASLFDVSHMLQSTVRGEHCLQWLESLCPADLRALPRGASALSVFLNDRGGIIDDLIVTKVDDDELHVVSNAGRAAVDARLMADTSELFRKRGKDVRVEFWGADRRALLALQGPEAAAALQPLTDVPLERLAFMRSAAGAVAGAAGRVTRCGYTGEDGFEISVAAVDAQPVAHALLQHPHVQLAGLGARDSLRLEAGLCLYGNDIDESVTPVEAALTWLVAARRRRDGDFPGADVILRQMKEGVARRRVGVRMERGPAARAGALLRHPDTLQLVGRVTSGGPAPSLGGNVAMGYVDARHARPGTALLVTVRGRDHPCVVAKMPFVPTKYYIKK